ncbi:hypothetical protein PsAD5_02427 [Pseudovibrio sp. Ad5]|nr:hypothetical protein PsAD5_02427 [Pseudovibrio sp. Ad5]
MTKAKYFNSMYLLIYLKDVRNCERIIQLSQKTQIIDRVPFEKEYFAISF